MLSILARKKYCCSISFILSPVRIIIIHENLRNGKGSGQIILFFSACFSLSYPFIPLVKSFYRCFPFLNTYYSVNEVHIIKLVKQDLSYGNNSVLAEYNHLVVESRCDLFPGSQNKLLLFFTYMLWLKDINSFKNDTYQFVLYIFSFMECGPVICCKL